VVAATAAGATVELELNANLPRSSIAAQLFSSSGAPVNSQARVARFQSLYRASALTAAGLAAGERITGTGLLIATAQDRSSPP